MAAAVAGALLIAACSSSEAAEGSVAAADVVHVHGLGVSQEGAYVATHHGLYEVVGDSVRAASDAGHDLMGFTVAGPGALLASGHPVSPDDADLVVATVEGGIGRSRDGGRSWEQASSEQLVFVDWGSRGVYGITADGQLAVSEDDGDTWDALGTVSGQPEALLAADDAIYAAVAGKGIVRSTDGGQTFEMVVDAGA